MYSIAWQKKRPLGPAPMTTIDKGREVDIAALLNIRFVSCFRDDVDVVSTRLVFVQPEASFASCLIVEHMLCRGNKYYSYDFMRTPIHECVFRLEHLPSNGNLHSEIYKPQLLINICCISRVLFAISKLNLLFRFEICLLFA